MGTASELPLDILGCIADVLGNFHKLRSQNRQAVKDLQMLCLTCKSMVPICRRHLFAHIEFIHTGSHWWYNGLNEFLLSHPTIATHYLKSLHIRVTDEFSALDYELLQKIRLNSSALTSIKILSDLCCWDDLSNRVKSVVYSLIQMPTLRHLTLNCIENFPAAALQSLCIGLKELTFHDSCSLAPPVSGDDAMQNPTITTLAFEQTYSSYNITFSSLTKPIGQNTVFAFDRVKNIYANIPDQAEGFDACKVLERAICLEHLELSVDCCLVNLVDICASLATSLRPTLRSIILDLGFIRPGDDISDLNIGLQQLAGKNVLQVLEVKGNLGPPAWYSDTMHWSAQFDQLVTDIGAFPVLRQVTVKLVHDICVADLRDAGIPSSEETGARFPRLLESTAIEFKCY